MAIKIVVDSASDITPAEAEKMGITHVPLTVSFNGEVFKDAVTLTHRHFYEKLIESDTLPTTSQPTPADFESAFRSHVENGDTVIAVVLSSVLSGTYQSATIAASEFPGKVFVVDSKSATIGERILVERAVKLVEDGLTAEQIVEMLEKEKTEVRVLGVLDTLEYLKKGGRISAMTAFAGGMLNIKPVVTVDDGAVVLCGKARGSKNGNNLLRKFVEEVGGIDFERPYAVAYSGLSDVMLSKYLEDSEDLWRASTNQVPMNVVGSVIGTHVGPGAIAVAFFEKK